MEFREFVRDEYLYVEKYKSIYSKLNDRDTPRDRRKSNTVANEMQVLKSFFTELEDTEEITRSPFRKISRERCRMITKKNLRALMGYVGVSEEGISYVHYLPQKTKGTPQVTPWRTCFVELKTKIFGYSWRNFALYMWRHKNDTAGV